MGWWCSRREALLVLAFTTHGTITKRTNPHFPSWTRPPLQEAVKDYLQQVACAYIKLSIEHTSACLSICLAAPPLSILAQATQNRSQHRDKNKTNPCLPTGWHSAPPQNTTFSYPAQPGTRAMLNISLQCSEHTPQPPRAQRLLPSKGESHPSTPIKGSCYFALYFFPLEVFHPALWSKVHPFTLSRDFRCQAERTQSRKHPVQLGIQNDSNIKQKLASH